MDWQRMLENCCATSLAHPLVESWGPVRNGVVERCWQERTWRNIIVCHFGKQLPSKFRLERCVYEPAGMVVCIHYSSPVSIAAVLTIAALAATAVIKTKWARRSFQARQMLFTDENIRPSHIALLAAENRNGKPRYCWALAEAEPALPHMQMVDLPFTHITVAQRQGESMFYTMVSCSAEPGYAMPIITGLRMQP